MSFVRWSLFVVLASLSLLIAIGQWWSIYSIPKKVNAQGQRRSYSLVPFIGGMIGTMGCMIAPLSTIQSLWWIPLLLDPGCGLLFGFLGCFGVYWVIHWLSRMRHGKDSTTADARYNHGQRQER